MELFDFDRHYNRIRLATTPEEIAEIRNEYDTHFESLPKNEQEIFVLRLREHARDEVIRAKALIQFVKEIMGMEQETA
jgi:hypothetical protein